MKPRTLIGLDKLEELKKLAEQYPIATAIKMSGLTGIRYRTVLNIINADLKGYEHVTRPAWLVARPDIQTAPPGWRLTKGLTKNSEWIYE